MEQQITLNGKPVVSAYSGKDGKCCCGCAGKHYHKSATGDYRGGGTPKDLSNIRRIINLMTANGGAEMDGSYASLVIGTHLYIAYFN